MNTSAKYGFPELAGDFREATTRVYISISQQLVIKKWESIGAET
jgi:hypothetical protein